VSATVTVAVAITVTRIGDTMAMRAVGQVIQYLVRCQCARNLGPARVVAAGHEVGELVGVGHAMIIAHVACHVKCHTQRRGSALPRDPG